MIEIIIRMHEDQEGQPVEVKGPLASKVLCLGMLEVAKQVVLTTQVATSPLIRPAMAGPGGAMAV